MASDKQRREVAMRMREILRDDPHGWLDAMVMNAVTDVMGEGVAIGETVADLIDQPDEMRGHPTCEMKGRPGERYAVCTRCGAFVRRDAVTNCTSVIPVKYCPNCGAEVV